MFEENVKKFKTRLISRGYPKQKVDNISSETKHGEWNEALKQKLGTHKKILRPFCHTISTVITKLEKHT